MGQLRQSDRERATQREGGARTSVAIAATRPSNVPRVRWRWVAVGGFGLAFGFALVLFRGEPILASDQGVYLSVAARMLDGDHLYSETIENKDPLFFYTYAAALWVGGWRGPFLLDGLWFGLAAVSFALMLRELRVPRSAVVAGFFVYPLALSAGWYLAGQTILGALAVAPLAPWLWLRGRFAAAGVTLGVVMLLKLNLAAVAVAPLAIFVIFGAPEGRRWRPVAWCAAGLSAALTVAALILAVRGELRAYLELVEYNVYYSGALADEGSGFLDRARQHLDVVLAYFENSGRWQLPAVVLVLGAFCAAAFTVARRANASGSRLLAAAAAGTLVLAAVSLALTAYWFHHVQLLAYPAALVAATLVAATAVALGPRAGALAAAVCVLFALWSSLKLEDRIRIAPAWTTAGTSTSSQALEEARRRFYADAERVTYMAFGGNSENAHAVFISDRFDLVCRWFHLYPHSTDDQLDETTECSEREEPALILVTLGFFDDREGASWQGFIANARRLLDSRYDLVVTTPPDFQVWKRRET